jgi:hypothetical protein
MTPAARLPRPVADPEFDEVALLEADYLEATVVRIQNWLASTQEQVTWAEQHGEEKTASETRQLAASWRTIRDGLAEEARKRRAQVREK